MQKQKAKKRVAISHTRSSKYERYKMGHKREKNKINRLLKHLKSHPNDMRTVSRIEELKQKAAIS